MTDEGGKTDHPGLIVPPPIYPLGAMAIAVLLEWQVPWDFLAQPTMTSWQTWFGIVLALSGLAFMLSAVSAFSDAGTNVEPHKPSTKLVTAVPYTLSRNPIYLGFLLTYLGLCLIFALEWGLVLFPLVWLALDRMVVVKEEAYLKAKFGEDYDRFCKTTRRWF